MIQLLLASVSGVVTLQGRFMGRLDCSSGTRESVFLTYGSGGLLAALAVLAGATAACAARAAPLSTAAQATQTAAVIATPAENPTPVSYTTPHPAPADSALDGSYAILFSSRPQWWKCLRCADYRLAGGIWRLRFDQGTMRIGYDVTGWKSLASYVVEQDQLALFNDPYCPEDVGRYRWQLQGGALRLRPLEDACAFGLRAETLQAQAWLACESPVDQLPAGCQPGAELSTEAPQVPAGLTVTASSGDSRFFDSPPRVVALAGSQTSPAGIQIDFSPDSIGYGLSRVLWWEGNWVEAATQLPFEAMGVQFLGDPQIGWARVLLDSREIWRGNTSELGALNGRHGGYVEVSGFDPGPHALRIEALGWDYRPVTVASFGFR